MSFIPSVTNEHIFLSVVMINVMAPSNTSESFLHENTLNAKILKQTLLKLKIHSFAAVLTQINYNDYSIMQKFDILKSQF